MAVLCAVKKAEALQEDTRSAHRTQGSYTSIARCLCRTEHASKAARACDKKTFAQSRLLYQGFIYTENHGWTGQSLWSSAGIRA